MQNCLKKLHISKCKKT